MGILRWISKRPRLTPGELADQLERLLNAKNWSERTIHDELDCVPIHDPALDEIRVEAMKLSEDYAASGGETYFGPEQRPTVDRWIQRLRTMDAARDSA